MRKKKYFRYIGDGQQAPKKITCFGYSFELNGPPIHIENTNACKVLSTNPCFKQVDNDDFLDRFNAKD